MATHLSQCSSTLFVRLSVGVGFDQLVIIYGPHRARFSSTFSPPVFFGIARRFGWFFLASFSFAALTLLVSAKFSFACFIFLFLLPIFFFFFVFRLFSALRKVLFACGRRADYFRVLCSPCNPVCVFFSCGGFGNSKPLTFWARTSPPPFVVQFGCKSLCLLPSRRRIFDKVGFFFFWFPFVRLFFFVVA